MSTSARPSMLDNQGADRNHAAGLDFLARDLDVRHPLSVATGYVNLEGLHHLAVSVSRDRPTRLLLGAAPSAALGSEFPATLFERTVVKLSEDRDLSRFPESRALQKLTGIGEWLERDDVQVRRYVAKFLHGKAYLFGNSVDARAALVTSANLTAAGMRHNLELGLVHYSPVVAGQTVSWFDGLWDQAADYKDELRELLFPDVGLLDPRTVYLRALLELFGDMKDEDGGDAPAAVQLASFQEHGLQRARAIVKAHGGVVFADGVGTGKTEIGLAMVENYGVRQGRHVLIVVPAQLRKHWRQRLDQTRLPAEIISYHDLAAEEQLAGPNGSRAKRILANNKDSYRLILVDEAHALRNPDTRWYQAMTRLLGGVKKDVVLLTATPINNGLWDLYHMVMTFARHDRAFAGNGIPSLRELFKNAGANSRDPENLNPDVLFPLADLVSVRRDRRFIQSRYPGVTFPDGTPVSFPTPALDTARYDIDRAYPGLVSEITALIGGLTMARYRPSQYRKDDTGQAREATLSALLQSGILKRFESCWHACALTVGRILAAHRVFLEAWERGRVLGSKALRDAARMELDESVASRGLEELLEDDDQDWEPTEDYDPEFREDVEADSHRLERLHKRLGGLSDRNDPKLSLLCQLLERSRAQKVAVFSAFADTVRYLDDNLPAWVADRERIMVIGAETTPDQRTQMLSRFCPATVVGPEYRPPKGEVDLLLSNDVLSEGQNLQQAAAVISYDMPWNPQRMVQRYGRVIRLKSPHERVHLTTMLPKEGELEQILGLEVTIRRKILAAGPYGMEVDVVARYSDEARIYAKRLVDGDPTLLDDEDDSGSGEVSSETLRAILRRELEEGRGDELSRLPWGVGAAFRQGPGVPSVGPPGFFFACRVQDRRYWRYVDDAEVIVEPAEILRRIACGEAPAADEPTLDLEAAWQKAAESIVKENNDEVRGGAGQSLGPVQQWARDVLIDPSIGVRGAEHAYEALGAGRNQTVRRALGELKRAVESGAMLRADAATEIVRVVELHGLRKVPDEEERSEITEEDIGVVCWMGVLGA